MGRESKMRTLREKAELQKTKNKVKCVRGVRKWKEKIGKTSRMGKRKKVYEVRI